MRGGRNGDGEIPRAARDDGGVSGHRLTPVIPPPAVIPSAARNLALALALTAAPLAAQAPNAAPAREYTAWVGSEGDDRVSVVRFDAATSAARVERAVWVGVNPAELVGPHGLGLSPDGRYYFVSTAHGTPNGGLLKLTARGDTVAGRVTLGAFPATLQVSPDGAYVWVANFNLHGDMVPSSVSVVYAPEMLEVARVATCTMPHGSRLSADGRRHYSACMVDDLLVEIDAQRFGVARHLVLTPGAERGVVGAPPRRAAAGGDHSGHDMGGHATGPAPAAATAAPPATCTPTWAQPSPDGRVVWVACSKANTIVEVDVARWAVTRRLPAGDGVYNLAVTRDGRTLVATNKRGRSVSVFDVASGRETAHVATIRRVPSGVAVSPDGRYAFVTVEGVGAEPGTVEILDLAAGQRVAAVDVGPQAGGVDVRLGAP